MLGGLPFDLRSGAPPFDLRSGARLSIYSRGLRHSTTQFKKDMQNYTPPAINNATANLADAYTRNKQDSYIWLSHYAMTPLFAL
jgi:hypothetical protein